MFKHSDSDALGMRPVPSTGWPVFDAEDFVRLVVRHRISGTWCCGWALQAPDGPRYPATLAWLRYCLSRSGRAALVRTCARRPY